MTQAVAIQRAGIMAELPGLLREHGLGLTAVFAGSGVDPDALMPESRLPFATLVHLLDKAALVMACPHLGLLLGQRFTLSLHGLVGQLMRSAPTLKYALVDFTSWQPGYSSGAIVYFHRLGDDYAFGYGAAGSGSSVLYDLVAMIGVRMLQELTDGQAKPAEIHLSHRQPRDRTHYARHIARPVRFNQQRVCLVLEERTIAIPLPGADRALHQRVLAELEVMAQAARSGVAARTRHALRHALALGEVKMDTVATSLAMHPRTLRRRLAAEQTSFEALTDALRFDMAREFLDLTDIPVAEISDALGYATPSVFSDAFHRWSGLSPLAWRRRTAAGNR